MQCKRNRYKGGVTWNKVYVCVPAVKEDSAGQGGTTCFRYVTPKRIITNIPIAHVIHRLYAGFLTDRHWTVVRNLKLRRGLLIVQLKASSILVQFIENDRNKV